MPWSAGDAKRFTKAARSARLQRLWASVANAALRRVGEGAAIRMANAAVRKARKRRVKKT